MTIQELFVRSNEALRDVIDSIDASQWNLMLPDEAAMQPTSLYKAVVYHTYDDAWVPDVLAGKTADQVGDIYEALRTTPQAEAIRVYDEYNERANQAASGFTDLEAITHLSYGDFPARDYLQHIVSFRAFRAYDIAKLTGADTELPDDLVHGLWDEFSPVIESYRQMGVCPPAVDVPEEADLQTKLLGLAGRT